MRSRSRRRLIVCVLACILPVLDGIPHYAANAASVSGPAYKLLNQRVSANRISFYVYKDQDSGLNHGFPSGFFANRANLSTIHIDSGCVNDFNARNGCSTNASALDEKRGTVFRITFDPQATRDFAGIQIEEPEHYGALLGQGLPTGNSYDLAGTKELPFYARSPDKASLQFGVGGCVSAFSKINSRWTQISLRLDRLQAPLGANPLPHCPPDINHVHILFSIGVDDLHGKNGATVLLDDIQFTPVPVHRASVLSFPIGTQTFGVVPLQMADPPPIPFPADQVLRNLTITYESAIGLISLLARGKKADIAHALEIANAFDYVLHNDNHGDPIPLSFDGAATVKTEIYHWLMISHHLKWVGQATLVLLASRPHNNAREQVFA